MPDLHPHPALPQTVPGVAIIPIATLLDAWITPIADLVERHSARGGFLVIMPEYRPDLSKALAYNLDLGFFDVRAQLLTPLGWNAHAYTLPALDAEIGSRTKDQGLLLHNMEALLATKAEHERRAWLWNTIENDWPSPVMIVLAVFGHEAPADHPRVHAVARAAMPEQTTVGRLIN